MKRIGRKLLMQFGANKWVALEKYGEAPPDRPASDEALMFDIYEFDGKLVYRAIGKPAQWQFGRDVTHYITTPWLTQEEEAWLSTQKVKEVKNMSADQFAQKIETILKSTGCPTAQVAIVPSDAIDRHSMRHSESGHYLGVSAGNSVEIDKVQAVMTMTSAKFEDWIKDENGEFMVYFIPYNHAEQ